MACVFRCRPQRPSDARRGAAAERNGLRQECLDEGSPAVFISEQAKAVYEVHDHASVKDDVGYYLEITGEVNENTKTVFVKSVKRLSEVTALCLLPRKVGKK